MKKESVINILSNAKKIICNESINDCKNCHLMEEVILDDDYIEKDVVKNICATLNTILDELEKVE